MDKLLKASGLLTVFGFLVGIGYSLYWLDHNFGPGAVILSVSAFILVITFMLGAFFMHWHTKSVLSMATTFVENTSKSDKAVTNMFRSFIMLVRDENRHTIRREADYEKDVMRLSEQRMKALMQDGATDADFYSSDKLSLEDWAQQG